MGSTRHAAGQRPSPAMVVALIALLSSLAGVTWAATSLSKNSVKSKQVKNESLKGKDIKNDKLTGADVDESSLELPAGTSSAYVDSTTDIPISNPSTDVLSTTLSTAGAGRIVANASLRPFGNGGGDDFINCRIEIDGVGSPNYSQALPATGDSASLAATFARSVAAGSHTVDLVCNPATASDVTIGDVGLAAVGVGG